MSTERQQRIAFELVAVAPGASLALRHAAGMGIDSATSQPLGLITSANEPPERGQP